MKQKRIVFFLIVGLSIYSVIISKGYPYQKPHRLENREFSAGSYALNSINLLNVPSGQKFNFNGDYIKNESITKSGLFVTSRDNDFRGIPKKKLMIGKNTRLSLKDSRGNIGLIVRIIDSSQDKVVVYLYNTAKQSGSKLIFDVDKFERYLTQTYTFNSLKGKPVVYFETLDMPALNTILLNFALNAEKFDFSDPSNPNSLISPNDLLTIEYIFRERPAGGGEGSEYYKIYPITQWKKIAEPDKATIFVSYQDLYSPSYGPIIRVVPMTNEDKKIVLNK